MAGRHSCYLRWSGTIFVVCLTVLVCIGRLEIKKAVEQRNNYATGGNFAANVQALITKAEQI